MSKPPRLILPKTGDSNISPQPPNQAEPNRRREAVPLACQKCRARKVKCDGQRPSCTACRTRSLQCEYKDSPDATTRADLQRRFIELERRYQELLELYEMLKSRPEAEAYIILQRLRRSTDVHSTIAFIKEGDLLINPRFPMSASPGSETSADSVSTEILLTLHHPKAYPASAANRDDTEELGLRRRSILEMNPEEYDPSMAEQIRNARCLGISHPVCDDRILRIEASRWTGVTTNDSILANLISLYLSWDHATMRLFDEDYFLDQIAAGQPEYCSPLLVNSLLAAASLNYSAIDKEASQTMGHAFFREASRLWVSEEDEVNILKVPSAILMSAWSNWNGNKDMGRFYLSQALQVAQRIGLFQPLNQDPQPFDPLARRRQKAIAVIAWGLFNFQTINGFFGLADAQSLGPPSFPIPYDAFSHEDDRSFWDPFPLIRSRQILHRGLAFRAISELLENLNAFTQVQDLSNPYEAYDKAKILHGKMLGWADNLPPELVRGPESLPGVLDLHMFYHGIIAKAFRPFAGDDFPYREQAESLIKASSTQLRRLLHVQRHRFDGPPFNATTIGSVHVLTLSLLEGLARSEEVDGETSFDLVVAAEAMKRYGEAFPAIHKSLHRLLEGASRHHAELPHELKLILEELSARFFGRDMTDGEEEFLPIDLQIGMTDHSGGGIEKLVNVTHRFKLGAGESSGKQ